MYSALVILIRIRVTQSSSSRTQSYPFTQGSSSRTQSYPFTQSSSSRTQSYPFTQGSSSRTQSYPFTQSSSSRTQSYPFTQSSSSRTRHFVECRAILILTSLLVDTFHKHYNITIQLLNHRVKLCTSLCLPKTVS